jgi:hypothetical protein
MSKQTEKSPDLELFSVILLAGAVGYRVLVFVKKWVT